MTATVNALSRVALVALVALAGCTSAPVEPPPPAAPKGKVELVAGAEGDVAAAVQKELSRARGEGRELLVYVGAAWCEPCQRFHKAAAAGELDATFPGLRLVEFDLGRDRDALEHAGYASKMIPLFAVPRDDGTGSGQQIEGSIKGDGAVAQITPRLTALLATGRRRP